jgi:hypothetical protein
VQARYDDGGPCSSYLLGRDDRPFAVSARNCGKTGRKRERALVGTRARSKVAEDNPRCDRSSLLHLCKFPVLGRFTGISSKNREIRTCNCLQFGQSTLDSRSSAPNSLLTVTGKYQAQQSRFGDLFPRLQLDGQVGVPPQERNLSIRPVQVGGKGRSGSSTISWGCGSAEFLDSAAMETRVSTLG